MQMDLCALVLTLDVDWNADFWRFRLEQLRLVAHPARGCVCRSATEVDALRRGSIHPSLH